MSTTLTKKVSYISDLKSSSASSSPASLDLAVNSQATPALTNNMAMGYGFAQQVDGVWTGLGQTHLTLLTGAQFSFGVYDEAIISSGGSAATLNSIQITFTPKDGTTATSPFNGVGSTLTITSFTQLTNPISVGCDIQTPFGWTTSSYTADNLGDFELLVTVQITPSGGSQKTFEVDPRIIVTGTNY